MFEDTVMKQDDAILTASFMLLGVAIIYWVPDIVGVITWIWGAF